MTFNSDEVNFLVYRYLEESGFHHSAYMFGHESAVVNAGIDTTLVPRGALMSLLHKGMLFAEAEVLSLVTNNAEGADIEQKFEKTIGSMSLIESTMVESVRQKIMERRMREDLSSRTCSPHPGTSASTANPTPQPSSAADSCSGPVNSNGASAAVTTSKTLCDSVTATSATHPYQHHSAANSSSQPPQLHKMGTSLPASASQLPASSNLAADRISPMIPNHANSSTPSIINPCYRSTQQRERDFRSQQSTTPLATASSSGNISAASFTVGLPPRGAYRATGQSLEQPHRMSGQAAGSAAAAQHSQLHQGMTQFMGSATLRGATQQLPQNHGQQAPSIGHDHLNTGSMGNGLHINIQPATLAQAAHHQKGALGIAKTADRASELLIEGMHQHPQRLLSSNGSYQQLSAVGPNSALINSGQKKTTMRLDGVAGSKGGAAQPNNGNNSGSVFNAPYYK